MDLFDKLKPWFACTVHDAALIPNPINGLYVRISGIFQTSPGNFRCVIWICFMHNSKRTWKIQSTTRIHTHTHRRATPLPYPFRALYEWQVLHKRNGMCLPATGQCMAHTLDHWNALNSVRLELDGSLRTSSYRFACWGHSIIDPIAPQ